MAKDPWHYPRTALADQYLKTLAIGLSKSLVLFAQRRMGKTEFLRKDLLPAAEKAGYITIYVSLWESREDPQSVLLDAIRKAAEGGGIISGVWRRLGRPGSKIGVGANASTVGAQASWEQGTAEASERMLDLRQWMNTLAQKKNPTLLLVDEIQTLSDEKRYGALVAALRSALDKHGDQIKAIFTGSSSEDPKSALLDAIRKAAEGEGNISGIWRRLGRPGSKGVRANAGTVSARASWERGTAEASERMLDLRQWMNTLAEKKKPTLLLVDEIQTLADEKRHGALVAALRSALDKHGDQIKAVFTGSSSEGLRRMFQMEKAPFFQFSHQIPFPQLGPEFVQHMLRAFANATQRQLNEAEAWQAFTDLALVPEHFRLMMANMVQLGNTDIAAALEDVKTAIQKSAEYPSKWAELTPIDQNMPLVP
ncbi:hypothetical protein HF292_010020 [Acidithiobacillus ferruginosus]|uniref:Uncharacterized protein n=4 Tax=Acidithiobacillus TaxID=119977 RepID=A0ACD5IF98_9PROT